MVTLSVVSLFFLTLCFIFRKKLAVLLAGRGEGNAQRHELPAAGSAEAVVCRVFAFNAEDYGSTGEFENHMELRLEQCLAGLARQGHKADVELHASGRAVVCLVKYTC